MINRNISGFIKINPATFILNSKALGATIDRTLEIMIITLVNHKDSISQESLILGLGRSLTQMKQNVLLVDMDPEHGFSGSIDVLAGFTIADALEGKCDVKDCFRVRDGITMVVADSSLVKTEFEMIKSSNRFLSMRNILSTTLGFDFVIIDCTPSHALLALNAVVASSHMMVALPMNVTALRDLDSLLFTIENIRPYNKNLNMLGILPIISPSSKGLVENIREYINTNYSIRVLDQFVSPYGEQSQLSENNYDWLAGEVIGISKAIQIVHPN